MPKSLADGHLKITLLTTKPKDPYHVSLAELAAGIDISCRVLSSDFKFGPTESETVDEKPVCVEGKAEVFTNSNYELAMTLFRFFNALGQAEPQAENEIGDLAYQTLKHKGTTAWVVIRFTSKKSKEAWANGDEQSVYEFITDNPVPAEATGYIKYQIPCRVQDAWLDGVVGGSAVTLTALTPANGAVAGGTSVTLTGTGFVQGMQVTFDGINATSVTVSSDTSATAVAPAHAAGTVDVVVVGTGSTSTPQTFTYA